MLYLKLFLQLLPQIVELLQTLAQVDVTVELDKGLDEIRYAPLGFHLIAAKEQTHGSSKSGDKILNDVGPVGCHHHSWLL